jgi:diguanylate cyclase (GGDEF)-like protein
MRFSSRAAAWVWAAFGLLTVAAIGLAAIGALSLRSATDAGNKLANDELRTAGLTARFGQSMDAALVDGYALASVTSPSMRSALEDELYNDELPVVESDLIALEVAHQDDLPAELATIDAFAREWARARALLNTAAAGPDDSLASEVLASHNALGQQISTLITREENDAADEQAQSSAAGQSRVWTLAASAGLCVFVFAGAAAVGGRRLRRALEPAQEQVEFADTLQFAQDEDEARRLLQRHLERLVTRSSAVVLSRNNSADRLEAVTDLPAESELAPRLSHAEPRSCLAIRSARVHDEDERREPLLACDVCGNRPGWSTCTPLTVGGEVIGSVLVSRDASFASMEQRGMRDAVGQAAPVLANLRNLAIAELRAATDSLTGLPNKRAIDDTVKRMLAQASRTLTPLSMLLLDLDHFKDVNDKFGHQVGDQALAGVGAALRSAIRDSDFAGRNGGEEFAVLLPDTDTIGALGVAEKIRAAIADISFPGLTLTLGTSIGVAVYPDHAVSAEKLERLADSALYTAKRSGRDRVEVAVKELDDESLDDQLDQATNPR